VPRQRPVNNIGALVVGAVAALVVIIAFVLQLDICLLLMLSLCDLNSFIYETEHHNGIAELLEILGRYNIIQISF